MMHDVFYFILFLPEKDGFEILSKDLIELHNNLKDLSTYLRTSMGLC